VWLLSQTALLHGLEDWMLDSCFARRGSRSSEAPVVLIGLDGPSLEELGKPYAYLSPELAAVVAHVRRQGAAAIGVDLMVPESLSALPDLQPGQPGDAATMGQAILEAGNVVLAQALLDGRPQRPLWQWQTKYLNDETRAPTDLASVNLTEDGDQFIRRQQLLFRDGAEAIPHFALALYARARGAAIEWDDARRQLSVGGERVPLDAEQMLRINFAGPPGRFQPLPFREVLAAGREGRPLPGLNGAVVLIGVTARDQHDYHATPYANHYTRWLAHHAPGLMAGTELHAHVLATLYDRAYITTPGWLSSLPLLLVSGAGLGRVFARLRLGWGLVVAVGHHFAWKGLAVAAFAYANWRVEMVAMLLLGFVLYAATFAWRWRTLRRMFGVVRSEAVAMALESDPHQLDRRGEERVVTVLFADIRSFTDFSETHSPHEVVALLNAYFSAVVPVLEAEGGTVNTFMGDGVMVLFGAPATCPDHALRAVRAAVAMVRAVHERRETWARMGNPRLRIGVGVHTGPVVVGAIGSERRLDYTAIGDTVNAAARIEAENKRCGTEILLSAATYAALPAAERARLGCPSEPEEAVVKGKKEALLLYPVAVPEVGQGRSLLHAGV
jgi:class 3 adenylate cyclase/CHASE2 domain-containing sensor protein